MQTLCNPMALEAAYMLHGVPLLAPTTERHLSNGLHMNQVVIVTMQTSQCTKSRHAQAIRMCSLASMLHALNQMPCSPRTGPSLLATGMSPGACSARYQDWDGCGAALREQRAVASRHRDGQRLKAQACAVQLRNPTRPVSEGTHCSRRSQCSSSDKHEANYSGTQVLL